MQSLPQFFSPTCPKANFRNKIIFIQTKKKQKKKNFIQTNSFIIFTCPNSVLHFPGFGQVG